MTTPFDIWAPIFRAPFSGNVTQEIVPRVLSPDIVGIPEIEHKIQTEVASFGTQLGIVLRALDTLCTKADVTIPELDRLIADVASAKADSRAAMRDRAAAALATLKSHDPDGFADLIAASTGPA